MKNKSLPIGVCQTHYYNASDRLLKMRPRPCFVAYYGGGYMSYRSRRFMIDTLGQKEALRRAIKWRSWHAPLDRRTCDLKKRLGEFRHRIEPASFAAALKSCGLTQACYERSRDYVLCRAKNQRKTK